MTLLYSQLKIFFSSVTCAKPRSSRNSSIGERRLSYEEGIQTCIGNIVTKHEPVCVFALQRHLWCVRITLHLKVMSPTCPTLYWITLTVTRSITQYQNCSFIFDCAHLYMTFMLILYCVCLCIRPVFLLTI